MAFDYLQVNLVSMGIRLGANLLKIEYFNRHTQKQEEEKVYGDAAVQWLYGSLSGKALAQLLIRAPISQLYGWLQSSSYSKRKVFPFIENFQISMDDFLPTEGRSESDPYGSFNEFFIRRFKAGKRLFVQGDQLPAFSEARYFGYEALSDRETIPVKGKLLGAPLLLGHSDWGPTFQGGPLLLARLCPVDYHRFHFPDCGEILDSYRVGGVLHSVNPLALKKKPSVFVINERQVSILETERFGKLAYVEVGAICVGKIHQSFEGKTFLRGQEKGYFLFGGSTVIVQGEKGKWRPSLDILENTKKGFETYLQLGAEAGIKT